MHKNHEGYADPTAGSAISRIMKEYRRDQKRRSEGRKECVILPFAGDREAERLHVSVNYVEVEVDV